MPSRTIPCFLLALALFPGCKKTTTDDEVTEVTEPASAPATNGEGPAAESTGESPGPPPETTVETHGGLASEPSADAIAARVADAKTRLNSTPPGERVWAAIEAHGGLEPWFAESPFSFRFSYRPLGGRPATDTYQTVDTWTSRARQQLASDRSVEFGWDGQSAWVKPPEAKLPTNPRFWALTPYYFVGIPFVLGDPGVKLEALPDAEFEETSYDVVKASFGSGVGDAPNDYYVLYIHPETSRVEAIRYVVSYPGFYPDGGHGAEKLMSYDGSQTVAGLTLPETYRTFEFDVDTGELGEKVTEITLTDLEADVDIPTSYFSPPDGARIIEGWK